MAGKKQPKKPGGAPALPRHTHIEGAGSVESRDITETLESNYMPYAMSVIMSRAIPQIDGFKPSHRKLLYTMHQMGLQNGPLTKSANIVGAVMKLNPHGDAAIYETMVRLSSGYQALLHPFILSKGNFGRAYSSEMEYAASRYTEAKLAPIAAELFRDIGKDTVDFTDNYDATVKEPTLLPVTFPSVLVNSNVGIAVGMASNICSFNLSEVCETAIALMKNPRHDILSTLKAPDFPGGGQIVYRREDIEKIYETGRGSVKIRAVYRYDKAQNCIDITEIPPTATVETIIAKIVDLVKAGKLREIADVRNEIGLDGLRITVDLKRGADPEKLMARLFSLTPLEDSFSCNFNILIGGVPKVMGIREILEEWTAFRTECVRRRVYFDLQQAKEKLHLLEGLARIVLDIDKAIRIIRATEEESEVVPNLMSGFGIDRIQAEYVADIRLRYLNREYITRRTEDIGQLRRDIAKMEEILRSRAKVRDVIISELRQVGKTYGQPRRTAIVDEADILRAEEDAGQDTPDYPCTLFCTAQGYFKKITPQSLRMNAEQKLKEGDRVAQAVESSNRADLLFFTDRATVYKAKAADFPDTKSSAMGEYIPSRLGFEEGESVAFMAVTADYGGFLVFAFENGKAARVELSAYRTKTNRKKLIGAYGDKSPLAGMCQLGGEDEEVLLRSSSGRILLVRAGDIPLKAFRGALGVQIMRLRGSQRLIAAAPYREESQVNSARYRAKTLPASGALPSREDAGKQLTWE